MARKVTEQDVEIGQRIRARRLALRMSLMQLADAVGVAYQQVQKYEQGTNRIAGSRVQAFAAALYMTVGELLGQPLGGSEGQIEIGPDDHRLLKAFRSFSAEGKAALLLVAETMATGSHEVPDGMSTGDLAQRRPRGRPRKVAPVDAS